MTPITNTLSDILSEEEICHKFSVTPEQIDKASRVLDCRSGAVYYQVQSQSDPDADPYEVRYNAEFRRLTCTCKAGQHGIPCWHKRAAMAAAREYLQEQRIANAKEQAEQEAAARAAAEKRAYEADVEWQAAVREADHRERAAVRKYGSKAYDSGDFKFLK